MLYIYIPSGKLFRIIRQGKQLGKRKINTFTLGHWFFFLFRDEFLFSFGLIFGGGG
jgi:hypothetical protein